MSLCLRPVLTLCDGCAAVRTCDMAKVVHADPSGQHRCAHGHRGVAHDLVLVMRSYPQCRVTYVRLTVMQAGEIASAVNLLAEQRGEPSPQVLMAAAPLTAERKQGRLFLEFETSV